MNRYLRSWEIVSAVEHDLGLLERHEPGILLRPAYTGQQAQVPCMSSLSAPDDHLPPVAELPSATLCPNCCATPEPDSPIFPRSYVEPLEPVEVEARWTRRLNATVIPDDIAKAVIDEFSSGEPTLELLRRLGISSTVMYHALGTNGIAPRLPFQKRSPNKH